jgi:hypothetical protein
MNVRGLINTTAYDPGALITNGLGCGLWVVAYATLVLRIHRKQFVEIPAFVGAADLGWELVWSFFFHPDTGRLFSLSYQGAFLLDVFIFTRLLKYGHKQLAPDDPFQRHFRGLYAGTFLFWALACYLFAREGYDTPIGANSGYIINVILSALSFSLMVHRDPRLFSPLYAWCRTLGTGLITVSLFLIYPTGHFVQVLGVTCALIDATYLVVLHRRLAGLPAPRAIDAAA